MSALFYLYLVFYPQPGVVSQMVLVPGKYTSETCKQAGDTWKGRSIFRQYSCIPTPESGLLSNVPPVGETNVPQNNQPTVE